MSKLLMDESPLLVLPSLAKEIGLEEAVVLQQIHWLLGISKNERDGHLWVYNTYPAWQKNHFPWMAESSMRRVFDKLRQRGLLITGSFNKSKSDRTLWYRINYDALESLTESADHLLKMSRPSAQNEQQVYQETTAENTIHFPPSATEEISPSESTDSGGDLKVYTKDGELEQPKFLVEAVCYGQDRDPAAMANQNWWRKQVALAKKILERGYDRQDVLACSRWLKSQSWVKDGFFDLVLVNSQIDKWDVAGRPKPQATTALNAGGQGRFVG